MRGTGVMVYDVAQEMRKEQRFQHTNMMGQSRGPRSGKTRQPNLLILNHCVISNGIQLCGARAFSLPLTGLHGPCQAG